MGGRETETDVAWKEWAEIERKEGMKYGSVLIQIFIWEIRWLNQWKYYEIKNKGVMLSGQQDKKLKQKIEMLRTPKCNYIITLLRCFLEFFFYHFYLLNPHII